MAQFVVIDDVFVAQRDADDPLHHQRADIMLDIGRVTRVGETGGQPVRQADYPVRRAEQQRTRIRGDPPAVERCHHGAAFHPCKLEQRRATLCRHRDPPLLSAKTLSQKNFRRFRGPVHLQRVRNPG
jgi:hypothetical protein